MCQVQNKGSIILTISCRFEFEDGIVFESLHLRKRGPYHAWRVIWIHCRIAKKLVFNKKMNYGLTYIVFQYPYANNIGASFQSRYNF